MASDTSKADTCGVLDFDEILGLGGPAHKNGSGREREATSSSAQSSPALSTKPPPQYQRSISTPVGFDSGASMFSLFPAGLDFGPAPSFLTPVDPSSTLLLPFFPNLPLDTSSMSASAPFDFNFLNSFSGTMSTPTGQYTPAMTPIIEDKEAAANDSSVIENVVIPTPPNSAEKARRPSLSRMMSAPAKPTPFADIFNQYQLNFTAALAPTPEQGSLSPLLLHAFSSMSTMPGLDSFTGAASSASDAKTAAEESLSISDNVAKSDVQQPMSKQVRHGSPPEHPAIPPPTTTIKTTSPQPQLRQVDSLAHHHNNSQSGSSSNELKCTCAMSTGYLHQSIVQAILKQKRTPGPLNLLSSVNISGTPTADQKARIFAKKETGNVCANCKTQDTCLWRQVDDNAILCNACGLYYRAHRRHRPPEIYQKRSNAPRQQARPYDRPALPGKVF